MESPMNQIIYFTGSDENNSFSVGDDAVVMHASSNSTENRVVEASNKVKISPIVRFDWDKRAYFGRVIAVHKNGQFVAYSLKPATPPGGGAVRVIHMATAIKHLMKGFNGRVVDLDFSCRDQPTLACIDENGLVVVYTIHLTDNNLEAKRLIQITPAFPYSSSSEFRRLRWCPYVPSPDSSGTSWLEAMLAVSHGCRLELFDVDFLAQQYDNLAIKSEHLKQGHLSIEEHNQAITEIAPSPDGFAIATASLDGSVYFYELPEQLQSNYVMNRMYHWKPHDGRPVNTLIFLDDRRPGHKTNLWCNALTGTDDSRELSIWSCDRWEVIQHISIRGPPAVDLDQEASDPAGKLFVRSDLSGRLIVLSDVTRSVLYVLELKGAGGTDAPVHCRGVHEFVLASTCLDLAVINVKWIESDSMDDLKNVSVEIDASGIYPKSLQSLQILFNSVLSQSPAPHPEDSSSSSEEEVQNNVGGSSSLTGVSPVSSMLTGLNIGAGPSLPLMNLDSEHDTEERPGPNTSAVVVVEEERGGAKEEWPAAPELHMVDVLSSRTSSSTGGVNVAIVAPHETTHGACEDSGIGRREMEVEEEVEERQEEDQDEEDAAIHEIIEALGGREADDSDDGDEEDNDDELGNDGDLEEEGQSTEHGEQDMEDGDESDDEREEEEEEMPNSRRSHHTSSPIAREMGPTSGGPPVGAVIGEAPTPAWVSSLIMEVRAQAEQVTALQRQLAEERQERLQVLETMRRMEATSVRLTDQLTQGRNEAKSDAASLRAAIQSVNEGTVNQVLAIRKSVEQKMVENHHGFMTQQEQLFQKMVNEVSSKVYHSVLANLNTMLSNEITSVVLPNVRNCIEDVRTNLSSTLQDKLMAMDSVIREQINKVFKQKNVIDMIGRSTADSLRRAVIGAVEEQTRTVLMPEVNSAMHHNANRLRELLRKSLEEVQTGVTQSVSLKDQDKREHIEALLKENKLAIDKQLTTSLRHLENSLEGYMTRLSKSVNDTMAGVSGEIREAVAAVPQPAGPGGDFIGQNSSPISHRHIPSPQNVEIPTQTLRRQMMQRLSSEQYTKALHEVLSHTRPELLSEFCRLVSPNEIFANPLPQNVVLSLLSQLTNTMQHDTENKLKFISEAVLHLDRSDPAFNTYGPKTLSLLKKKVEIYIRDNPHASFQSQLRLLIMALDNRG